MGKSLQGKNLGKGFTQRKDGLYQGTYHVNGKRKFLYDRNLRKLKQLIKEKENEIDKIHDSYSIDTSKEYTLNDIYEMWYNNRLFNIGLKYGTINNYISVYKVAIKDYMGNFNIRKLDKITCENVLNFIKKEHNGSMEIVKSVLSHLFNYAIDCRIIQECPLKGISIHREEKDSKKFLSIEDQSLIIKNEKNKLYLNYILLALNTGLRVSEICGIEIKNINLDENYLIIDKQMTYAVNPIKKKTEFFFQTPKTSKSNRIIPLNKNAKLAIVNQLNLRKKSKINNINHSDLLFINNHGNPISSSTVNIHLRILYNRIGDKLSVDHLSSHMLRHTFATNCLEKDINTRVIQKALGHTSDKITQIYSHVTTNKISISLQKLDSINYIN